MGPGGFIVSLGASELGEHLKATGWLERVSNVFDGWFRLVRRPGDGDDVEPGRVIEQSVLLEEAKREVREPPLFLGTDRLGRMPRRVAEPRLHLDEDDLAAIE